MSSEQLQGFFESTSGQISTLIMILLLFLGILISGRGKKADTKAMVTSAVLVALSIALNQIILFRMPQGGSVTAFCMLPIVVCAYMYGVRRGMMAGMWKRRLVEPPNAAWTSIAFSTAAGVRI